MAREDDLARDLAALPVGLVASHAPNPVFARLATTSEGWPVRWFFRTSVWVMGDRPLRMEQYGMAARYEGRWVYSTNRKVKVVDGIWPPNCTVFLPGEFEQEFRCPSGWLNPGVEYTDQNNWAGSGQLETFWQRWFFIAQDAEGRRFKGEADVHLLGSVRH